MKAAEEGLFILPVLEPLSGSQGFSRTTVMFYYIILYVLYIYMYVICNDNTRLVPNLTH